MEVDNIVFFNFLNMLSFTVFTLIVMSKLHDLKFGT